MIEWFARQYTKTNYFGHSPMNTKKQKEKTLKQFNKQNIYILLSDK